MRWGRALAAVTAAVFGACDADRFAGPQRLGGREIAPATLNRGAELYTRYCVSCHGELGDGRGPAAPGMSPPPRDFRAARFKYAGVQGRKLPHDDELVRIVRHGLDGTAMRAWDVPEPQIRAIVDYIKTFSPAGEGFRDPDREVTRPEIPPDPYAGRDAWAIAIGERLYHTMFQCNQCHPAYVAPDRYDAWDRMPPRLEQPYRPVPKYSSGYDSVLLPPDFLRHPMPSVRAREGEPRGDDLYRVIAYGLQGPMPGYGHLGAERVWAVAHYVQSLAAKRGTEAGEAHRADLRALPDRIEPPAPAE